MALVVEANQAAFVMIDSSSIRAHQDAAAVLKGGSEEIGASRGDVGIEIDAVVNASGSPIALAPSSRHHDGRAVARRLRRTCRHCGQVSDSDAVAESLGERGSCEIMRPRGRRINPRRFARSERPLYRERYWVECLGQRRKRFRSLGTRDENHAAKFLAMILLSSRLLRTL